MRVVALISGGKDSCYNMMQCIAAGHDIVALANLKPQSKGILIFVVTVKYVLHQKLLITIYVRLSVSTVDELDSYMYQSVGHQAVELYAEAMALPLFRQRTNGVALQQEKVYTHTPEDEVEDLFDLLVNIKVYIYQYFLRFI